VPKPPVPKPPVPKPPLPKPPVPKPPVPKPPVPKPPVPKPPVPKPPVPKPPVPKPPVPKPPVPKPPVPKPPVPKPPVPKPPVPKPPVPPPRPQFKKGDKVDFPVSGTVTSVYGSRKDPKTGKPAGHKGLDIATPVGSKVVATGPGKVTRVGWENDKNRKQGYGLRVWVDHGNGVTTVYAHLSDTHVKEGDVVSHGQQLGASGNTGKSTGPHLHYGEYVNGNARVPTGDPTRQ